MSKSSHLKAVKPRDESQAVHEWVYIALCKSILAGDFVPGVGVTLRGIAETFGVSPMPVREAIRRLVAEGALEVLTNRRVTVSPITSERLDELKWARLSLEPELASRAMENIRKSDIKKLRLIDKELNQSLVSGEVDVYIDCNRRFHFGIYEKANSEVLLPLVKSLWLQYAPFSRVVFGRVGTDYLDDYHADALLALERGDKEVFCDSMKSDIKEGMSMLAEHVSREH